MNGNEIVQIDTNPGKTGAPTRARPQPAEAGEPTAAWAQGWMPMPNPRRLGDRRRTAHLDSIDDLRGMLAHLAEEMDKAARTDSIDVMCAPFAGGVPGTTRFEPGAYVDALGELIDEGVGWSTVGVAARASG